MNSGVIVLRRCRRRRSSSQNLKAVFAEVGVGSPGELVATVSANGYGPALHHPPTLAHVQGRPPAEACLRSSAAPIIEADRLASAVRPIEYGASGMSCLS